MRVVGCELRGASFEVRVVGDGIHSLRSWGTERKGDARRLATQSFSLAKPARFLAQNPQPAPRNSKLPLNKLEQLGIGSTTYIQRFELRIGKLNGVVYAELFEKIEIEKSLGMNAEEGATNLVFIITKVIASGIFETTFWDVGLGYVDVCASALGL